MRPGRLSSFLSQEEARELKIKAKKEAEEKEEETGEEEELKEEVGTEAIPGDA